MSTQNPIRVLRDRQDQAGKGACVLSTHPGGAALPGLRYGIKYDTTFQGKAALKKPRIKTVTLDTCNGQNPGSAAELPRHQMVAKNTFCSRGQENSAAGPLINTGATPRKYLHPDPKQIYSPVIARQLAPEYSPKYSERVRGLARAMPLGHGHSQPTHVVIARSACRPPGDRQSQPRQLQMSLGGRPQASSQHRCPHPGPDREAPLLQRGGPSLLRPHARGRGTGLQYPMQFL